MKKTFLHTYLILLIILTNSYLAVAQTKIIGEIDMTAGQEMAPYISFDGKKMIFVVIENNVYKFYEATKKEDNTWGTPVALENINNHQPTAKINAPCYNHDASRIYFEAEYDMFTSGVDIFYSDRTATGWTKPLNLDAPINSGGYDGEPSISIDEKTIYFVREITGKNDIELKCKTIFVSKKDENDKWTTPEELPEPINLACDRTPRILADNKTLIFSSIREGGKDGYDFYFAKQLTRNVWLLPIPITAVNSELDELFPATDFYANNLIYSIASEKKKTIESNLYTDTFPNEFKPEKNLLLSGKITDLYTNKPIEATITVRQPRTAVIENQVVSNKITGEYTLFLPHSKQFIVDYGGNNYSHNFVQFSTQTMTENETKSQDIKLYSDIHLNLNIFDKDILEPQKTKINIIDSVTNKPITANIKEIDIGRLDITLPIGKKYVLEISKQYFDTYYLHFDLSGVVQFDEFERDVELTSRKKTIEFMVTDANSNEGISVEFQIVNVNTNEKYTITAKTDKSGRAYIDLREGDVYEIDMSPQGYTFYNTTLNLSEEHFETKINIKLDPLTTDTKFELNNISFETNSANLNASSNEQLAQVIALLNKNPNIQIEISAHTDDVGSDNYNLKLSERRAQAVVNYLIDNGITLSRLVAKGYGETKPLADNKTEENRAKNRRVELKILEL